MFLVLVGMCLYSTLRAFPIKIISRKKNCIREDCNRVSRFTHIGKYFFFQTARLLQSSNAELIREDLHLLCSYTLQTSADDVFEDADDEASTKEILNALMIACNSLSDYGPASVKMTTLLGLVEEETADQMPKVSIVSTLQHRSALIEFNGDECRILKSPWALDTASNFLAQSLAANQLIILGTASFWDNIGADELLNSCRGARGVMKRFRNHALDQACLNAIKRAGAPSTVPERRRCGRRAQKHLLYDINVAFIFARVPRG